MKKRYCQTLLFLYVFLLTGLPLAAQERLTLSEAVAKALENNPDLAVDEPGRQAARSEYKATRAGYLPRLDFEQSYLGGNNPVFVFGTLLTQRRFMAENFALHSLNSPSPVDNLQTRATVQQSIWDFGRTGDRREQARLGVQSADQSHEQHKRQVLLSVIEGYYATSLAGSELETSRAALRSAEAIENQAKARVESGLAVEADLLRSRVYLSSAKQLEIQALGQLEAARAQLNRLMGNPLRTATGETAPLLAGPVMIPAEETLLAEQKLRRPDYQNLLIELRQAELAVRTRSRERLPVLAGYTTVESDNPSLDAYGGTNWSAGITLRWNLFAGGGDAALLEASRHRLEQKKRQVAAMESAMALEVRRALIQYRSAERQVAAARAAEAQSEEGLRILRNRYEAGLATMTDLLSAETARSSARTNLAQAIFRQRLSYAQIEFAAGILESDLAGNEPAIDPGEKRHEIQSATLIAHFRDVDSKRLRRQRGETAGCGDTARPTNTLAVRQETIEAVVEAPGTVQPRNRISLSSQINGFVREMRVRAGDTVRADQVLALLDARDAVSQKAVAQAGIDEAQAALSEARRAHQSAVQMQVAAKASLELADQTLARYQKLGESRSVSPQELDGGTDTQECQRSRTASREAMAAAAEDRIRQVEAKILQAKAQAGRADVMMSWTEIKAPSAGRIVQRLVDSGTAIFPWDPAAGSGIHGQASGDCGYPDRPGGNPAPRRKGEDHGGRKGGRLGGADLRDRSTVQLGNPQHSVQSRSSLGPCPSKRAFRESSGAGGDGRPFLLRDPPCGRPASSRVFS